MKVVDFKVIPARFFTMLALYSELCTVCWVGFLANICLNSHNQYGWKLRLHLNLDALCCKSKYFGVTMCVRHGKRGDAYERTNISMRTNVCLSTRNPTKHNGNSETNHPINLFKSCYNVVGQSIQCIPVHIVHIVIINVVVVAGAVWSVLSGTETHIKGFISCI